MTYTHEHLTAIPYRPNQSESVYIRLPLSTYPDSHLTTILGSPATDSDMPMTIPYRSPILSYPLVYRTYPFVSVGYPNAHLTILWYRSATDSGRSAILSGRGGRKRIVTPSSGNIGYPLQWKLGGPWEFGVNPTSGNLGEESA